MTTVFVVPFHELAQWVPRCIAAADVSATGGVVAVDDSTDDRARQLRVWFPFMSIVHLNGPLGQTRAWIEGTAQALIDYPDLDHVVLLAGGCQPKDSLLDLLGPDPIVASGWRRVHWMALPQPHAVDMVRHWKVPDADRVSTDHATMIAKPPRWWISLDAGDPPPSETLHVRHPPPRHRQRSIDGY